MRDIYLNKDIKLVFKTELPNKSYLDNLRQFILQLVKVYSLGNKKCKVTFLSLYKFGDATPIITKNGISGNIRINKDLLKEDKFEELKGTLAHEFAHFYHFVNLSKIDFLIFIYKAGLYTIFKPLTKNTIIPYRSFMADYEKYTDLTALKFGYKKELIKLKTYIPIYRKNLPKHKIPISTNYLNAKDVKNIDSKELNLQLERKLKLLKLKSLKF